MFLSLVLPCSDTPTHAHTNTRTHPHTHTHTHARARARAQVKDLQPACKAKMTHQFDVLDKLERKLAGYGWFCYFLMARDGDREAVGESKGGGQAYSTACV